MIHAAGGSGPLATLLASEESDAAQALLKMAETGLVNLDLLQPLDMWHLLPLSTGAGETELEPVWLATALGPAKAPEQVLSISPVLLRALDEAANSGRVAETILLAHRIVGAQNLAMINPSDMAHVADQLDAVGQADAASNLRREIVASRLLAYAGTKTPHCRSSRQHRRRCRRSGQRNANECPACHGASHRSRRSSATG